MGTKVKLRFGFVSIYFVVWLILNSARYWTMQIRLEQYSYNLLLYAYKTLVEREGSEGALPGLGQTEEQLFFVAFAKVSISCM